MGDLGDIDDGSERSKSSASLLCRWEVPLIPLLERSCSDCGSAGILQAAGGETFRRRQGKFRRVLSETWNYPSWLFVESGTNSSSDDVGMDHDRECKGDEIVVVECTTTNQPDQGDSDSEDEGWYSLSRTDVKKLQEVRSSGEICDVNIILTNPDLLHLCANEEDVEQNRNQESSPERTSYSSLSSGDSGQLSDGSKSETSRKSSESGENCENSTSSQCSDSSNTSCDSGDSCTHKITVYVKYSESAAPLVEGCVDSEGEEGPVAAPAPPRRDTVIHCDNDTITICDTRVRLRLCPVGRSSKRRAEEREDSQFIPVKRKDLFKLLGLNESSDVLDPSEEADAKKVALQNFLSSAVDKNDKTSKRNNGILLAPKQGKKNLAKFLGIDMSALAEAEHTTGLPGGAGLDCESVSISSSTTSGGRRSNRILGMALPSMRTQSRGASVEKQVMEDIPEQLRTPKVPQANRKDLQRFLGLNDCEEMVYIRNVRRHRGSHSQSQDHSCVPSVSGGGTLTSLCSCVVCTNEYSSGNKDAKHSPDSQSEGGEEGGQHQDQDHQHQSQHDHQHQSQHDHQLVETKCDNEKCIMCTPVPGVESSKLAGRTTNNNNYQEENNKVQLKLPPPLPKKTVAPYQEYKFGLEEPMPSMVENNPAVRDRRRKKQATKRMEQLIKIHTENVEPESAEEGVVMRTLDKADGRGRRLHKRSILKHHSKSVDGGESERGNNSTVKMDQIRPSNMKVKFAGSLRKREQAKLNRRKMLGHPCQVHFPFHPPPEYLEMRHILAVVDPRYLTPALHHK